MSLSLAQLSMLLEAIDWRNIERTWQPGAWYEHHLILLRLHTHGILPIRSRRAYHQPSFGNGGHAL